MNYVSSSFGAAYTNFVSSQAVAVNCGSNSGRFIVGISTAINGGNAATRNLSSANYGGTGLTLSAVESNSFGAYFQAAYGATTLTGSNNFEAVCPNNNGGIFVAAAAFDGCSASPLSGLTRAANDTASPSATVTSATGQTVYAIVAELTTQSTITPSSGVTVVATSDAGTSRFHLLSIAGGSSVTIGGTFPGTRSWAIWAWSLQSATTAPILSSPTTVSTGNTIATVRVTTDTAPSGSSTLAVQVLPAADPVPAASAILASPTQTITSGASGARDFNLTSLTNGTAYRAHFAQTGPSNVVSTTSFTPSTVPGAPTIGTAVAGNSQATVNGTAPASNGGAAITGYRSTATPGGSTVTGASLPITHTGLTNGTAYTFTLAAENVRGYGAESAASNSVTPSGAAPPPPPPPPPPSGPTLPAVATDATGSSKRLGQTTRMVVEPFTNIESLGTGTRTIVNGTTDAVTGQITLTGLSPGTYAVYGFFPSTGTSLAGVRFRLITIT